jgi:hypothetical protein
MGYSLEQACGNKSDWNAQVYCGNPYPRPTYWLRHRMATLTGNYINRKFL